MKKNISHKSATSNQEIIDSCDFLSNAASTQDCTGLIPSGPMNEDELESYEAVYHYQPPRLSHKSNGLAFCIVIERKNIFFIFVKRTAADAHPLGCLLNGHHPF